MATTRSIPSSYTYRTAFDIYCDPTAIVGAGSGAGTEISPYTDLQAAMTAAVAGDVIGIRTGRTLDVSADIDIVAGGAVFVRNNIDDLTFAAWRPTGAPDTPSIFYAVPLVGPSASDWQEVDVHPGGAEGTVLATNGNWGANVVPGTGYWHYTGALTTALNVRGVGYSSRESITSVVTPGTYQQHSSQSEHVESGWIADSGNDAVINTANGEATPFLADMQWSETNKGGLVVKSPTNPATRWGGVYVYPSGIALFRMANFTDFTFEYAFQAHYCGCIISLFNTDDADSEINITGLYGSHVGVLWSLSTDNLGTLVGEPGGGSVDLSVAANNVADHGGDGTEPYLVCTIRDVQVDHVYSTSFVNGWMKNSDFSDFDITMGNLQSNGTLLSFNTYTPLAEGNRFHDFNLDRIHCGAGGFGHTDWGIDVASTTGAFAIYDGTITNSAGTIQLGGARRGQTCHNVRCLNVLRGPEANDETDDGNGSYQVINCLTVGSDPAGWAITEFTGANTDFSKCVAFCLGADTGYPAKGQVTDTDTMSKNDGAIFDNNIALLGTCPAASFYAFQNSTLRTSGSDTNQGPWHDVDAGAGGTGANGKPVTNGQTQVRTELIATITNFHIGSACLDAQRVVNRDFNDCLGGGAHQQPVSALTETADAINSDGFPTASSPAAIQSGGTVLNAVTVDTTVDYTRVATNVRDMRGIPRWSTKASMGPIQYIPVSPTTRAL